MALLNPINIDTGKAGWIIAGVMTAVAIILAVLLYIAGLELKVSQEKLETKRIELVALANLVEVNRVDYENKLSKLPYEIRKIETKYYPVIKEITKWKEDTNASDCNGSMRFINVFAY